MVTTTGAAGSARAPAHTRDDAITCGFCGSRFAEDRSQATCQACPLSRACGLIRCPTCGYENPRPPRWLGWLRSGGRR